MESAPQSVFVSFASGGPGLQGMSLYTAIVLGLMAALLILTWWLGDKKPNAVKCSPYESGIIPSGSARFPFPAPFYLVAIFFLIFDVEAAYIFSWAIVFEDLGWKGWLQITFFIFILLVSFLYIWKKGGLEWGPVSRKK